ncbi:Regulator of nonsense transcripts UPF2 (Nonsense mRNA reducing factor UPF2) (Up-frameshift suppressor 2 homolog) (AtUpf2) [Durusdinium trenchii]|uniref:Regulator of nonsense transcripts UPF2 (Nonsense mRNA reducing factor UPF2) (Up-frameshift suppressor 2 homolog) (AtUpf2) n=1 Tax=Durusdinium trenchii TaxID=1381693 RepID=A0ABP0HEJ4_9DINO
MLRLTTNSLPPILSVQDLNHHANYEHLSCVASLLSGLAKYRDAFVIDVIDSLLENIQVTLERNDFREMPLRVRQVKLVGELYNYRLVDSVLVFDSLYQCAGRRTSHFSRGVRAWCFTRLNAGCLELAGGCWEPDV